MQNHERGKQGGALGEGTLGQGVCDAREEELGCPLGAAVEAFNLFVACFLLFGWELMRAGLSCSDSISFLRLSDVRAFGLHPLGGWGAIKGSKLVGVT
jgi:hypothetical protein